MFAWLYVFCFRNESIATCFWPFCVANFYFSDLCSVTRMFVFLCYGYLICSLISMHTVLLTTPAPQKSRSFKFSSFNLCYSGNREIHHKLGLKMTKVECLCSFLSPWGLALHFFLKWSSCYESTKSFIYKLISWYTGIQNAECALLFKLFHEFHIWCATSSH